MIHSSQSGFERSSRWEKMRPGELAQLLVAARARQRGVAHVVVEVEARVVHPERPAQLEAAGRPAAGGSAGSAPAATRAARRSRRARAAGPRRSRARPRACATPASPGAGTTRRSRSAGPCEPACPRARSLPGRRAARHNCRMKRVLPASRRRCWSAASSSRCWPPAASAFGRRRLERLAARAKPRARTASTPRPPSGCCASRWSWARGRRARRASRRLAARLAEAAARRPLPGGARRAAQRGRARAGPRRRASWCWGRTTTRRTCPGFVGANDGASGTAVAVQLARTIRPRTLRRTVVFVLFDGEESPRGTPDARFARDGPAGQQGGRPALPRRSRDGAARLRRRPAAQHPARGLLERASSGAALREAARARPARRRAFPAETVGSIARRPPPVPPAGGALDRPHRLRLRLLPPALRRPVGGLRAQPRRHRGDRAPAPR